MKQRTKTIAALAVIVIAILSFGIFCGFAASASGEPTPESVAVIETKEYYSYEINPEGYRIDNRDTIPHTGEYVIYGEANMDLVFVSENGESVTYDVTLHNWNAVAWDWYGLISLEKGVTLNLTVLGNNVVKGFNHPGIKLNNPEETGADPIVNLNLAENSRITFASQYQNEVCGCIAEGIEVNLGDGVVSNLDMTSDSWREEMSVTFTRGVDVAHKVSYTYVDDNTCHRACADCDLVTKDFEHEHDYTSLDESDENYATKHNNECRQCGHVFEALDHNIRYDIDETSHKAWCNDCNYAEDPVAHTLDEHGCTVCKATYIAGFTAGDEMTKFMTGDALLERLEESGGTLTLLSDVKVSSTRAAVESGEIIIDLAGFKLDGLGFIISEGAKVSIIDSSEAKTGEYTGAQWNNSSIYGTLSIDGITLISGSFGVYADGKITVNNVTVKNNIKVINDDTAKIELGNLSCEGTLEVNTRLERLDNISINGGSFAKIIVTNSYSEVISVNMLLDDGYAYCGENGLLDGSKSEISGVTSIVEHPEHNEDVVQSNASQHWVGCACGYYSDTVTKEDHILDESGMCPTCKGEILFSVSDGDTVKYFTGVTTAVEYANGIENPNIKLLADVICQNEYMTFNKSTLLDLNGHTLRFYSGRIYAYAPLTLVDTSAEQTGRLLANGNIAYAIEIRNNGSLTVNSGEVFGLIYTSLSEGESAVIEINGGRFTGSQKFRLSKGTTLVINDGWFENEEGTIECWASSGISIVINGGTFKNNLLISEYSYYTPTVEEILGADGECELAFTDEKGTTLTDYSITDYRNGIVILAHKGANLAKAEGGHKLVCPTCQSETELIEHNTFIYEVSSEDATKHTVTCGICEYELEPEGHFGGEATCDKKAVCQACNTEYGEMAPHSAASEWSTDGEYHWKECTGCTGQQLEKAAHSGGTATCTEKAVCVTCNTAYGNTVAHSHGSEWKTDENEHWNECACGDKANKAAHNDGNADGKCDACDYQMANGGGLPTGAVIGIVAGSATAVCVGGFAIFWFLIKKKRWSDLIALFKR